MGPIKALVKGVDEVEESPIVRGRRDENKLLFKKDLDWKGVVIRHESNKFSM